MNDTIPPSLSAWIDIINQALGTSFELDEPGKLFIEFENGTRVGIDFPDGAHSYDIYAPISLMHKRNELPRLMTALQLNLYQRQTSGGVIGLDMLSGTYVYSITCPVDQSSPEVLAHQIEEFVVNAERLRAQLANVESDTDNAEIDLFAERMAMVKEDDVENYESGEVLESETADNSVPLIRV